MTASPNTRRKIAPGAVMVLAVLGALALLVTFVMQVASDAPPRDTDQVRAEILTELEESTDLELAAEFGTVLPDTLEIIDRTSEGVVAYAFVTSTNSLGTGIKAKDGGARGISAPGEQTATLRAKLSGAESTSNYELSVRRSSSGSGYEHTLTAR